MSTGKTPETSTTSDSIVNGLSETALFGQKNLTQLTLGYERWMKGLMNVAMQQIEVDQDLLKESVEDLNLLTAARTPDAFVQAELEVLRRSSQRALGVAQKVSSEFNRTWSEATKAGIPAPAAN